MAAALGALSLSLLQWRTARRWYAWAAEYPEYRCAISGLGMRNHRPDGTAEATRWDQCTGWTETRNLFVRAFDNGNLGWLPKRGALVPEDLDRLRATLDANLRRL
ncbi:YcxB family protein [Streptomyces sp. NPDC046876]|uniref:YcxB family protein n=1 Tax=Streptomyces sp. NPDC046876 TaxID=3155616 RepID=UPI0033DA4486